MEAVVEAEIKPMAMNMGMSTAIMVMSKLLLSKSQYKNKKRWLKKYPTMIRINSLRSNSSFSISPQKTKWLLKKESM
jgi:hypothetical protein